MTPFHVNLPRTELSFRLYKAEGRITDVSLDTPRNNEFSPLTCCWLLASDIRTPSEKDDLINSPQHCRLGTVCLPSTKEGNKVDRQTHAETASCYGNGSLSYVEKFQRARGLTLCVHYLKRLFLCHTCSCTIFHIAVPPSSAKFCSLSYECVGIATSFSVAIASSALHRLVTVFHCV
jgi:hypothetical protein